MDRTNKKITSQSVQDLFERTGYRNEVRALLEQRLASSGWTNHVEEMCRKKIRDQGVENIVLDDLIGGVRPDARRDIPEEVKKEIVEAVREFVKTHLKDF